MRYKILFCIFAVLVFCSTTVAAYASTETIINAEVPMNENNIMENSEVNEESLVNIDENSEAVENVEASESNIPVDNEEFIYSEADEPSNFDYTENLLTIIELLNLSCACMIASTIIIIIAIISMRWI